MSNLNNKIMLDSSAQLPKNQEKVSLMKLSLDLDFFI